MDNQNPKMQQSDLSYCYQYYTQQFKNDIKVICRYGLFRPFEPAKGDTLLPMFIILDIALQKAIAKQFGVKTLRTDLKTLGLPIISAIAKSPDKDEMELISQLGLPEALRGVEKDLYFELSRNATEIIYKEIEARLQMKYPDQRDQYALLKEGVAASATAIFKKI